MTQTRQQAYRRLLEGGLIAIRNHAHEGMVQLCEIEADHIHNLPSLLDEPNEERHRCYVVNERSLYIERLKKLGATAYLESMSFWNAEPWKVLASIARVELTE